MILKNLLYKKSRSSLTSLIPSAGSLRGKFVAERKKLSITRKHTSTRSDEGERTITSVIGSKKRIVIAKPETKQKEQPKKKKPKKPPSTLRVNELDAELCKLSKAWRSHKPLSLGVEKQIFKAISDGKLSASKRVVRALMRKHCNNPNYLRNTVIGLRYDLTDSESGYVVAGEAAYALKKLRELTE